MNLIDILFLLGVLGGLALGFFQGTIRLAIAIVSFYVSIILASLYFQRLGVSFVNASAHRSMWHRSSRSASSCWLHSC